MTNKLYKLMNWPAIEEIIYSESDCPQKLLGAHSVGSQTLIQAYFPEAVKAELLFDNGHAAVGMELADEDGFFAALLPQKTVPRYSYRVTTKGGATYTAQEAYRFAPQLTREDTEKFKNGIHYTIYEKLGAHPMVLDGVSGTCFAVWAPSALRVSVVGDFNNWDGRVHQMCRLWDSGIFELFVPGALAGDNYKFEIKQKGGSVYLKADPYENAGQLRPETASVITELESFRWEDDSFLKKRAASSCGSAPVSIYELYLGSFIDGEEDGRRANYREIAGKLITYVKKMGYTHVELMPVMEHPLDASWGYQTIGYYAPTARYGSPKDFMFFINEMHKAGIGVILDWSPAHFPKDAHGLCRFDGTCLYEHQDPRQGFNPQCGTLLYNYGRAEVSNYLIANALFWVEKYHADGIRMDAVSGMLYLDYGKAPGEWLPNLYGGNENLEAIELIKHLNSMMKKRNPGVLMIAGDSASYPMLTEELDRGGLGFDLLWNRGFMNDYTDYIRNDPYFRSYHHNELTFSLVYAYSENFLLACSHDEVVHGRSSMLGKMPGNTEQRFANLRLTYAYLFCHPGKKLLFMGQELGEPDEWNERRSAEWGLLDSPEHAGLQKLVAELNKLYQSQPALYEADTSPEGFEWINAIASDACCLTFLRKGLAPGQLLLVAANFSGIEQKLQIGVPLPGKYKELLNTDSRRFGGSGRVNARSRQSSEKEWDDRKQSVSVRLAPLSLSILQYVPGEE